MIGIICAMQVEADGILALCENKQTNEKYGMTFTRGTLGGKDVVAVVCGEGKVNAAICATTLINDYKPDLVLNSGVAGALSPVVTIGDLVVGTKAVEHDMNMTPLGYKQGEVCVPGGKVLYFNCDEAAVRVLESICSEIENTKTVRGVIASGDIFVSDRSQRMRLNDRFGAIACEMEGASIGHVCYRCGVPFAILRAISDDLNENKGMDFIKFCKLASQKTVYAVKAFVESY